MGFIIEAKERRGKPPGRRKGEWVAPLERIWEPARRRETASGCWEWLGSRKPKGYGQLSNGQGRVLYVHRVAYELLHGPIAADEQVLHRCDNPPCFAPAHLFAGSAADNTHDMMAKGRANTSGLRPGRG